MERQAAFHRQDGGRAGPARSTVSAPVPASPPGDLEFPPFDPPELLPTRGLRWALLGSRALMLGWAAVTALRVDAASDDPVPRSPSGTVTAVGWVLVAAWFAVAARWSWVRTNNVHRLEGRYPSLTRAAVVWVYPAVWVLLMGVTLVPATPNPDFDYRPPIIVAGFVLAMTGGYRIVHRIFKSLVRMPPTATCVAFYLVDVIAFGLIWWRVSSWTGRDGVAPLDAELDLGILVAACVALAAALLLAWYLDRSADRGQEIRLLALRTRYDHRMARLNGLDPMNPQTRYALMLARRAAERAAKRPVDERTPDALAADDPLLAELARELEQGITPDFAARVRELERRTDGLMPTNTSPTDPVDRTRDEASPPRLWLAEALRYVVVGIYGACVVACVALVVLFRRGDADAVETVRRSLYWGAAGVHMLVALWAVRIAVDARRFGLPALWRLPASAFATSVVVVPLWFAADVGSDAAKLALFTVLTLGLELALWRITAIDWLVVYRESDSPLEAWMSVAPFVLGLLLLSPMRNELALDVSSGRVAFFAAMIGLAAALSGGLAAVAMVQLEDALRATTPGGRAPDVSADPPPAPAPIERSAGTTRTPTAKPRAEAAAPLRVDLAGMSAEVAAGLGIAASGEPAPDPAPTLPAETTSATAAKKTPAKKTAAKKTAAKKTAATNAAAPDDAVPTPTTAAKKPAAKKPAAKKTAPKKPAAADAPVRPADDEAADVAPVESSEATSAPAAVTNPAVEKPTAKKTAAKKTAATKKPAAKKTAATKTPASEERPLALDAEADDRRADQDAADPVHEVERAADRVGRLGEVVDQADQGEQDHDVAEPGDDPHEAAGPGER